MTSPTPQAPAREAAPSNSLPTWRDCALRVDNSDFIAKRVREGGYGAEGDSLLASALHRFIYEYDDGDPYKSGWFLHRLELVLIEERSLLAAKQEELDKMREALKDLRAVVPFFWDDDSSHIGELDAACGKADEALK